MSDNQKQTRRLPRQQKGGPPLMLSRSIANVVLDMVEAILNLQVTVPVSDGTNTLNSLAAKIDISEKGAVITMPPQQQVGTGGGGGSLELTDGTTDLTGVTKITVSGATVGGTSAAATLTIISGGSPSASAYNWTLTYSVGNIVWVDTTQTFGDVSVLAGMYICIVAVTTGSPTGNLVPQFPLPTSGIVYWRLLSFAPQTMGICNASGSQGVYVQASGSFGV